MQAKTIELRALSPLVETVVYTVQGDTGRELSCKITDMEIPSGATAIFWARKPSGKGIQNRAVVSGQIIQVELTNQILAENGKIACQIQISSGADSIKTYRFTIINEESYAGDWPESENQSTWLEGALQDMQEALDRYINEKNVVLDAAKKAAEEAARYANNQGGNAAQMAQNAEAAANYANAVADDLLERKESGEFNGPPGPQGPAGADGKDGADGVVITISGQFAMQLKNDHLYVVYPEETEPPDMEIKDDHLILNIGGD